MLENTKREERRVKKKGREALPVLTRPTYVTAVLAVNCYGMIVAKCVFGRGMLVYR